MITCLVSHSPHSLSLCLFHVSRHTTQYQTQRTWRLSMPPSSVNSHSPTFTSRHLSCVPNRFTPQACVTCGALGDALTQSQLILTCLERFWHIVNLYSVGFILGMLTVGLLFTGLFRSDRHITDCYSPISDSIWLPLGARSRPNSYIIRIVRYANLI